MKTTHIFLGVLTLFSAIGFGQNVASTQNITSGGLNAGNSGIGNTFYGYGAGYSVSGDNNTYFGSSAGYDIEGDNNIAIGYDSGGNIQGNDNIFIGEQAGDQITGNENICIGYGAGNESIGSRNIYLGRFSGDSNNENDKLRIDTSDSYNSLIWGDFALDQLKFNAKVGIGYNFGNYPTSTAGNVDVSAYNLFVKGGILTEEVRVALQSTWADYVFKKDYKLLSLQEVENHIQEKGHLPNVPSAKNVAENGIELGEMTKIQQEKIEELTLYIIELNKKLEAQEARLQQLEKNNQHKNQSK